MMEHHIGHKAHRGRNNMKKYLLLLIIILILIFSAKCFVNAWDVSKAVYGGKFIDVSPQDTYPYAVTFSIDGSKMYVHGTYNERVFQYDLSTPWDVSTAVYSGKYLKTTGQDSAMRTIMFKPDGTKFYSWGSNAFRLFQYNVVTPWDISTGVYEKESPSFFVPAVGINGCIISVDGNNLYLSFYSDDKIHQYSLPTPWDVEVTNDTGKYVDVLSEDNRVNNVKFKPDGTKMYLIGEENSTVYQYGLSTPWDANTAVYEGKFKCVIPEETTPKDLAFKEDGTALYIIGLNADKVFQYTLLPHTSQYPPAQSDTYVKATTRYDEFNYLAHFATDPAKSLTGTAAGNVWVAAEGVRTNQRFHIDLGSAKVIRRIYYDNYHNNGGATNQGVQNFTFWGSNTAGSFAELTYATDTGWTELTVAQNILDQHIAADQADPKYITVTNETSYKYYAFKFADDYGSVGSVGIRRIELQTEDAPPSAVNVIFFSTPY